MTRRNEGLNEREVSALHRENVGPAYNRIAVIKDRAIEAHIEASLKDTVTCDFHNDYGFCKLDSGHSGTHTVIFLGKDD